jgi:hypothetical protein
MPEEFLSDEQVAVYRRYNRPPSRAELDRYFFLDDKARGLIEPKRRLYTRLGFAVQLTTVHYLGTFLADPTDVPARGGGLPGRAVGYRRPVVSDGVRRAGEDPAGAHMGDRPGARVDRLRGRRA